jgi:hypothetical protein
MIKMTIELSDEEHLKLLEIQLDRKRKKIEPNALNKIASEIVSDYLKKENPTK